jgi:hypothetical protein
MPKLGKIQAKVLKKFYDRPALSTVSALSKATGLNESQVGNVLTRAVRLGYAETVSRIGHRSVYHMTSKGAEFVRLKCGVKPNVSKYLPPLVPKRALASAAAPESESEETALVPAVVHARIPTPSYSYRAIQPCRVCGAIPEPTVTFGSQAAAINLTCHGCKAIKSVTPEEFIPWLETMYGLTHPAV